MTGAKRSPGGLGIVAVTGAGGFLGAEVCRVLRSRGASVRAVQRGGVAPDGTQRCIITDLSDRAGLRAAFAGADAIVHLAARVHVMRNAARDPHADYRRVNVDGTRSVMEEAGAVQVQDVVFASTVKAVGEVGDVALTSSTVPGPSDPYGDSKLEAERVTREIAAARGFEATILRFPLVYGPGMRGNMLRLFDLVWRGIPLPLGGIRNRRSLLFVGNAAETVARILGAARHVPGTFFVSDGEDLSTPDLVRRIGRALGRPARLVSVPPGLLRVAGALGDALGGLIPMPLTSDVVDRLARSLTVDASPLVGLVGAMPVAVDDGLAATARWFLGTRSI